MGHYDVVLSCLTNLAEGQLYVKKIPLWNVIKKYNNFVQFFLYFFTCLLSSEMANYKVSIG
jgi:hypothetical protein